MDSQIVLIGVPLCSSATVDVGVGIYQTVWTEKRKLYARHMINLPMTAMPTKLAAAIMVGGFLASPIIWV